MLKVILRIINTSIISICLIYSNSCFQNAELETIESMTYFLALEAFGELETIVILPFNDNIVLDGQLSEWSAASLLIEDESGDSNGPEGTDIQQIYIAQDSSNLFFFIKLDGWPVYSTPYMPGYSISIQGSNITGDISGYNNIRIDTVKNITSNYNAGGSDITKCNPGNLQFAESNSGIEIKVPFHECIEPRLYSNGVTRIEAWSGGDIANTFSSGSLFKITWSF